MVKDRLRKDGKIVINIPSKLTYIPKKTTSTNQEVILKIHRDNWKQLIRHDKNAKKLGQLAGRFITEPIGDGKAVYQIIREGATYVTIKVVTGIGDDWMVPYWGEQTNIQKSYAKQCIKSRDFLGEIFKGDKNDSRN